MVAKMKTYPVFEGSNVSLTAADLLSKPTLQFLFF